ncbi:hypothetical protein KP509_35G001100 [Ceratopteris richardii]|nr:hypothetical protein KP509_35G001100 [Ceratopteris richardii]
MAGLHLTRNRLLFFSVALFITLAVSVHVAPYFPSFSSLLIPLKSQWSISGIRETFAKSIGGQTLCVSLLHDIAWKDDNFNSEDEDYNVSNRSLSDPCVLNRLWLWNKNSSAICGFQKVNRTDTSQLLRGSWIMIAGDSQARLLLLALLDHILLSTEFVREDLFKRHSDYSIQRHNIKLDFIWAPYVSNLTSLIVKLRHNRSYPDVLIMGDGLWDMLHVTNASDYLESLLDLQRVVYSIFPISSYFNLLPSGTFAARTASNSGIPQMFWMNVPKLVSPILNTAEKREKLTNKLCKLYDEQLRSSKVLQPKGPLMLLNLNEISNGCGVKCTSDGMHYCNVVYDAMVQVLLNALLIATEQAPSR